MDLKIMFRQPISFNILNPSKFGEFDYIIEQFCPSFPSNMSEITKYCDSDEPIALKYLFWLAN